MIELYQEIIILLIGVLFTVMGYYLRKGVNKQMECDTKAKLLEDKLNAHILDDATKYVTRDEMNKDIEKIERTIRDAINPINDKLGSMEDFLRTIASRRSTDH